MISGTNVTSRHSSKTTISITTGKLFTTSKKLGNNETKAPTTSKNHKYTQQYQSSTSKLFHDKQETKNVKVRKELFFGKVELNSWRFTNFLPIEKSNV